MRYALKIGEIDNVVTVVNKITKGEVVKYIDNGEVKEILAEDDIPMYHKIAVDNIKEDENIVKYGENIGRASKDIKKGSHVHVENVKAHRENLEDKE